MLRTRVFAAVVLLPIVLLFVYLGGIPWLVGILLVGFLAWREMVGLLRRTNFSVYWLLGLVFVLCVIAEAYIHAHELLPVELLRPLLVGLITASLIVALFDKGEHPTADWGMTVAGALYIGFTLAQFVALRERSNGFRWVLLAFVLTWTIDATAYFVGRSLGNHRWWPRLSPKKTWEGLLGGGLAAIIAAPLLGMWWLNLSPWWGLVLGLLAAILDPLGDLAISLFKRMAQTKDTSNLIPGHGGVLDRLDSLLFIVPLVTFFAYFVSGP